MELRPEVKAMTPKQAAENAATLDRMCTVAANNGQPVDLSWAMPLFSELKTRAKSGA